MTPEERRAFRDWVRTFTTKGMSEKMLTRLALHGLHQKLMDVAVMVDTRKEKEAKVRYAHKLLLDGEWRIFR